MANQEYPSLNDTAPSWADVAATVSVYKGDILETCDFKGLKWSREVTAGMQKKAGRPKARPTGEPSYSASATLYREGELKLVETLAKIAPRRGNQRRISLVGFDIVIQWTPPIGEARIHVVKIKGCRYMKDDNESGEGGDPDEVEVDLAPMEIVNVLPGGVEVLLV